MYNMSSNIVVDVVNPSIIPIKRRQPSSQVTPLLVSKTQRSFNCYTIHNMDGFLVKKNKHYPEPFLDTMEASRHDHGDVGMSPNPTTSQISAILYVSPLYQTRNMNFFGKSTIKTTVLRVRLHFTPFTQKMGKLVPVC